MCVECSSISLDEYTTAREADRNLHPLTKLWISRIKLYSAFPTGYKYYVSKILREDPEQPRQGLDQLFGKSHHPLDPVLMFCEAVGSTGRKSVACSYVAMVSMMFYLMVNERWMFYDPPSEVSYSEAYPPHVFLLYYPRDFQFAANASSSSSAWDIIAREVPLAEFVHRVFRSVFAQHKAFQSIDTGSVIDNNLKKNWALFLSSRQFGELSISNLKELSVDLLHALHRVDSLFLLVRHHLPPQCLISH